jgi:hypothetical protein
VVNGCGQGGRTTAPVAKASVRPKPIQLTFFIKARQSGKLLIIITTVCLMRLCGQFSYNNKYRKRVRHTRLEFMQC